MKDKVSELMDGELSKQDAKSIIAALKKENALQQDWGIYHLIGDSLRQSSSLAIDVSRQVSKQLASEPVLIAPQSEIKQPSPLPQSSPPYPPVTPVKSGSSKARVFAFATAASFLAMISTWLVMHNVYQQSHPVMVAEQSRMQPGVDQPHAALPVLHSPGNQYPYVSNSDMTNYLYFHNFHKELSPVPVISSQPAYVYPVTDFQDNYGR